MKLVRYGEKGQEKPGFIDENGMVRNAESIVSDWTGATITPENIEKLQQTYTSSFPAVQEPGRLGTPLNQIGQVIGIGLNYKDHAAEAGLPLPTDPIVFMKAVSAINGPNDDIVLPPDYETVDWEVELAVVIGKEAKRVSVKEAPSYIAGYMIANDLSDRTRQLERGTQWTKGKSSETFCPFGPWLVTADEIADPQNLDLQLWRNDLLMQKSNSCEMAFSVYELVSRLSFYLTLKPGETLITGTPPGVAYGMPNKPYLRDGDRLRLFISGLGEQNARVIQEK